MKTTTLNNFDETIQKQCRVFFICGIGVGMAICSIAFAAIFTIKYIL